MEQPTIWKFTCINQEDKRTTEVSVMLPDDASWDEVLTHFAHFLDGTGYIGVVSTLDKQGALMDPLERVQAYKGVDVE